MWLMIAVLLREVGRNIFVKPGKIMDRDNKLMTDKK
jgi:hypothetical protein